MKTRRFILLIFSALALSCSDKGNRDTLAFEKYLQHQFNLSIEKEATVYLLMPNNQCPNCTKYDGKKIRPETNQHLRVISGFPEANFRNFDAFYFDRKNTLMKLAFLDYGNKLVTCRDGHITAVLPVTNVYRQLDSLGSRLAEI